MFITACSSQSSQRVATTACSSQHVYHSHHSVWPPTGPFSGPEWSLAAVGELAPNAELSITADQPSPAPPDEASAAALPGGGGAAPATSPLSPKATPTPARLQRSRLARLWMILRVLVPRLSLADAGLQKVFGTVGLMSISIQINSNLLNRLPGVPTLCHPYMMVCPLSAIHTCHCGDAYGAPSQLGCAKVLPADGVCCHSDIGHCQLQSVFRCPFTAFRCPFTALSLPFHRLVAALSPPFAALSPPFAVLSPPCHRVSAGQLQALAIQGLPSDYVQLMCKTVAARLVGMLIDLSLQFLSDRLSLYWQQTLTDHVMELYANNSVAAHSCKILVG